MATISVKTPDGLAIAAHEWGDPAGPEIVFIHGFAQCHLSWQRQVTDPQLADNFRMIAYDLRGHGGSDKPIEKEHYLDDRLWADELAAVIEAAGLKRPVLVGWSYAGRVVSDYLNAYGSAKISGINYVAAATRSDPASFGPGGAAMSGMRSDDLATRIASTRAFLRACFERQPSAEEFETMLAFNMLMAPHARVAMMARGANPGGALARLRIPVLVTHGSKDQIVLPAMSEFTAAAVKGAKLSLYDGIGHAPFLEDAPRFNRELAAFVREANQG